MRAFVGTWMIIVYSAFAGSTAEAQSVEVRAVIAGPSHRFSNYVIVDRDNPEIPERSLHLNPGAEIRVLFGGPRMSHGVLLGGRKSRDMDFDCQYDCGLYYTPDFWTVQVGYVFRVTLASYYHRGVAARSLVLSTHVSFAAGREVAEDPGTLVGGEVGVDLDYHFRRFFFGWSFRGAHWWRISGAQEGSTDTMFFWNIMPLTRFGFVFGETPHVR